MKQEALVGRTIAGKYCLETIVGEGAMGAVYRARQTTLGTTLAIKVLHRQLAGEPMFAARFLREAQAASRVDHPSSMRVIDFGEEPDGLLYIAMEYVDGKTLAKIIEEASPLPVARIVDIACQALAALAVAHDLGVIHRDLKPENIMVLEGEDDEGRTHDIVKVCDFGVAKLLESGSRAPSVTAQGVVVGTPEYMSPEQARGDALDARSDIYAMGVLLFHLMTGKVPFDSSTAFGTAFMHVNDEPTRPRLLNPGVDSRLEAICLKAMRKRPEDRFVSARE
ncbi:MAG: eukaryotic-like serine/threonine-protein kinase, partial [Myxococcales bacterium]|nr:eukaryotic-like serine/threonine-protein kinase [Myxococcales bacterium]